LNECSGTLHPRRKDPPEFLSDLKEEKGKGIKVSEWLIQNGVDTVYARKAFDGKGPSYVFSNVEVEVILTTAQIVEEICKKLIESETT
jgi:predicted Fe-Mo cluster-binding NifX family protein